MKNNSLLIACAIVFGLAACSADQPESPAAEVKPDVSLINTYWKLVELNDGSVRAGEGKDLHMILKGQDRVTGYSGCNQFMGSFTETGGGLSFGPIAGTRRMCESVMDQESAFLQALEATSRYEISGEDMAISDANGTVTMRFVAVYLE